MKIKDLPEGIELKGKRIRVSDELTGYWVSSNKQGVWFSPTKRSKNYTFHKVVNKNEMLDWHVLPDDEDEDDEPYYNVKY